MKVCDVSIDNKVIAKGICDVAGVCSVHAHEWDVAGAQWNCQAGASRGGKVEVYCTAVYGLRL